MHLNAEIIYVQDIWPGLWTYARPVRAAAQYDPFHKLSASQRAL